jgi:hypothetical protein
MKAIPLLLLALAAAIFFAAGQTQPAGACLTPNDCDGDGYTLAAEQHIFGVSSSTVDAAACGNHSTSAPVYSRAWPADIYSGPGSPNSVDRVTVQDLTSFLGPIRRIDTSQSDPAYNRRWDLAPGAGGFLKAINIQDVTNLITVAPPMFNGAKALGYAAPCSVPPPTGYQPAAPIYAAFFYPWFDNAWNQGGVFPYTNFTPSLGWYDSDNNTTIDQQLLLAKKAHLEAFIGSWWGQGHHTDNSLKYIISRSERVGSPYPEMRWSIYYEPEGQGDPSVSQIVSDLNYLAANYFNHPGFLRVNGKPVVFVWSEGGSNADMASRWAQAKAAFGGNVHIVLKLYSGYEDEPNQPDSWHQYGPATASSSHPPYSATVSPGFWKKGESPRLNRDPVRFEADVQKMVNTGAFWQLVTTWNEWGEGTAVEPATQFGNAYIDALCRKIPGPTPCVP